MKKNLSIIGSLIFLAGILLTAFQPIFTAIAEESQPKLLTVYHNGKKVKAGDEMDAAETNQLQLKATGDFTLTIPESPDYGLALLNDDERADVLSQVKNKANVSFDVSYSEESGYQIQMKKGMTAYVNVHLLQTHARVDGIVSFDLEKLPNQETTLVQLVQPKEAKESSEKEEDADKTGDIEAERPVTEPTEEPKKEVVFYKGDQPIDSKTTVTVEEGTTFNPTESITAFANDGSEEYTVEAEVKKDGKALQLEDDTFVPKTENAYAIQYKALDEEETVATMGIGLLVSNGSVDVSLEWVTGDPSQKYNQDFTIPQTGAQNVTYKVNVNTTGTVYEPGQLKITLPASQFQFSNPKNLENALGWHKNNISLNPLGASNNDTFGYEVSADGQTLIITNKKKITGTIQESFEISAIFYTKDRKYDGGSYPQVRGRQIIEGTNAKLKFDVEDATQSDPSKRNFSTNELKVTLKTQYEQPTISKNTVTFNPYENWDASLYGNRPTDFQNYYWLSYKITTNLKPGDAKRLLTKFKDTISVRKDGSTTTTQLTTQKLNALKIHGYGKVKAGFYKEVDGGVAARTIGSNAINWQNTNDRDKDAFYNANNAVSNDFYYVIGFPKSDYNIKDQITNTVEGSYYDADSGAYYDKNDAKTSSYFTNYEFKYPPGDTTISAKNFQYYVGTGKPRFFTKPSPTSSDEQINEGLVTNVLQSGNDVDIRTAGLIYGVNHAQGNNVPYSMEMYDDQTKWKAADSSEVFMGPDDFYFSRLYFKSETFMPNQSLNTIQKNGVVLPYLRLEYQDDKSGVWKKHPDLIEPTINKNRGVNPNGSTFDEYRWGRMRDDGQELDTYIQLGDLGIRAHRFRLVTVDKNGNKAGVLGKVNVRMNADICVYGVDPNDNKQTQLEKWIANKNDVSTLAFNNFSGFKVEGKYGNNWTVINPDHDPSNSRFPTDPGEYGDYLERRVGALTITGEGPNSNILKTATQKNNTATNSNDVTWTVKWGEGYEYLSVNDNVLKTMFNSGSLTVPERQKVILYDLLPAGHTYAGVQTLTYRDQTLTTTQYKVDILDTNYRNSQRQLIRLTIDGDSVTSKSGAIRDESNSSPNIRGNTVQWQYKSNVTWGNRILANLNATTTNRNSVTVSLFDDANKAQEILANGETRTVVNNDLISSSGHGNTQLGYVPLVGSGNTTIKNNMHTYGSVEIIGETSVKAGLNKYVKGDNDSGFNSSGSGEFSPSGTYQYRLDYTTDASGAGNYVENVVLFDKLEQVSTPNNQGYTQGWKGKLLNIDLSYAKSLGIDAKAYVSFLSNPLMFAPNSGKDFSTPGSGWVDYDTITPTNLKNASAFAIDLRKSTNGTPFRFTSNDYVNVTIDMEMPDTFPSKPKAFNVPWLSASKVSQGLTNDALTEATYTDFEVTLNRDLKIVKQDLSDSSKKLNGVIFEIEYPDGTKKDHTTTGGTSPNFLGEISLKGLAPGTYKIREKKTIQGYELLAETYTFTIKTDGTIQHQVDSANWIYNFKDDQITLKVNNRKKFSLPITGGSGVVGISLLLIVAVMIVVGTGWYLKKYRFQLDES